MMTSFEKCHVCGGKLALKEVDLDSWTTFHTNVDFPTPGDPVTAILSAMIIMPGGMNES